MTWIVGIIISLPLSFIILMADIYIRTGGDNLYIKSISSITRQENNITFLVYTMIISIIVRDITILLNVYGSKCNVSELIIVPGLEGGNDKNAKPVSRRKKWILFYPVMGAFSIYGLWVMSKS